ncbi:hypothetical protein B0A48_12917 [Cryoendolithus antarcticus]|uniref:CENP-V/GFA domain-containing protein n=1 Tax=Cryoendolithus antarcticus TaxID=1507870 RepID=A0A1V8SR53_9PEZI|nr:hypothetical protein B0A48_12917 [Cryoendolithus antarcticus]
MASNATKTLKASCLCGAASYETTVPSSSLPLKSWWCSCTSCRRMTGTLALCVVYLPESYSPPQAVLEKLTVFEFTKRVFQYFCSTCGSHILARCLDDAEAKEPRITWDAMSGTLEQFDGFVHLRGHEFINDTLDGGISDFIPTIGSRQLDRYSTRPEKSEQLPLNWRDPKLADLKPNKDKVHAQCKCGGVEFWIAHPSARSTHAASNWPDLLRPNAPDNPNNECWWLQDNNTKFLAGTCSCNTCRLASGQEIVQWAFVPTVDITLDAAGKVKFERQFGTLKQFESSKGIFRSFCGVCGASAFYWADDRPFLMDVAIGLLDSPEGARAEGLLEWRTTRLSYREDALGRAKAVVDGIESGLQAHGERRDRGEREIIERQVREEGAKVMVVR